MKDKKELAEGILLNAFEKEPFHSLYFLYGIKPKTVFGGGTCTDKVLSAKYQFERAGFNPRLRSSIIGDQECHYLLELDIDQKAYFADVGNGWPSIRLFPSFKEYSYTCFGITFSTKIFSDHIKIYQTRESVLRHTVTIPFSSLSVERIQKQMSERFNKTFPFSGKIRFAQIIEDRFLFLRDSTLHIYADSGKTERDGITRDKLSDVLMTEFKFDLEQFLQTNKK